MPVYVAEEPVLKAITGCHLHRGTMPTTEPGDVEGDLVAAMRQYPSMLAVMEAVMADPEYDFLAEFDAGLDLVLDGIDRWRQRPSASAG
ncbi:hypothetical protein GCM10027059_49330 [Myceligenerans halotolerans]